MVLAVYWVDQLAVGKVPVAGGAPVVVAAQIRRSCSLARGCNPPFSYGEGPGDGGIASLRSNDVTATGAAIGDDRSYRRSSGSPSAVLWTNLPAQAFQEGPHRSDRGGRVLGIVEMRGEEVLGPSVRQKALRLRAHVSP